MDITAAIASDELPVLLQEHPELVAATDDNGVSALLLTLYHRRPEARDALLAAGAPVGPLEAAALGDVAKLEGADLSVRGGGGFTPPHLAAVFRGGGPGPAPPPPPPPPPAPPPQTLPPRPPPS